MNSYISIKSILQNSPGYLPEGRPIFFKIGKGDYAEHDKFINVKTPALRKLAKDNKTLPLTELKLLLESPINEERLLALFILVNQYEQGNIQEKEEVYQFYINNLKYVNNWNLVDSSAHLIIGAHLISRNKDILLNLARSPILWERRIAIISTWYFIKNNQFEWALKIANSLLKDNHDLIHKAVGWMLRELGKQDIKCLENFLNKNIYDMPRTMLRYAIEKFPENQRKKYLETKFKYQ